MKNKKAKGTGAFFGFNFMNANVVIATLAALSACTSKPTGTNAAATAPAKPFTLSAVMTAEEFEKSLKEPQRTIAESPFGGKSGEQIIESIVFDQVPITKYIPPVWFFTTDLLISKAKGFVDELDMSASPNGETIKNEIKKRLDSKSFVEELIPFIFAVKDLYLYTDEDYHAGKFHTWALQAYKGSEKTPGFWHDLFPNPNQKSEEKKPAAPPVKDEKKEGGLLTGKMAAAAAEVYYDLFLKDNASGLADEFVENKAVVDALVAKITDVVSSIAGGGGGGDSDSLLGVIKSDPVRKEGVAIALIKFIHSQKTKYYNMLLTRQFRRMQLKHWLTTKGREYVNNPNSPGGKQFLRYLEDTQNRKRYAMQVVVDGLQGSLVQALSFPVENVAYLEALQKDHATGQSIAANSAQGPTGSSAVSHSKTEFLDYLVRQAKSGVTPHKDYMRFFRDVIFHNNTNAPAIAKFGVSSTPTISVRNIPIALTGAAHTGENSIGLPNFHFVDRDSSNPTTGIEARIEQMKKREIQRINQVRMERNKHLGKNEKKPLLKYEKLSKEINDRAYYFYGSDAMWMEDINAVNGLITMPDRLSALDTFTCTSPYDAKTKFGFDAFINVFLGEKEDKRDYFEIACLRELRKRKDNEIKARGIRGELIQLAKSISTDAAKRKSFLNRIPLLGDLKSFIEEQGDQLLGNKGEFVDLIDDLSDLEGDTLPQYLQYYNPFPDHFAHGKGPYTDQIIGLTGEYNRLSFMLEQFYKIYEEAGLLNRTFFGMAGDHGLTPVYRALNPEVAVFERLSKDESAWSTAGCTPADGGEKKEPCHFVVRKISSDEGEGPKINNVWKPNDDLIVGGKKVSNSNVGKDVVIASTAGGNYMMDFFKSHGDANWKVQPIYEELTKIKLLSGQTYNAPDSLYELLKDSLDYMAIRETHYNRYDGVVRVIGPRLRIRDGKETLVREEVLIHSKMIKTDEGNSLRLFYEPLNAVAGEDLLDIRVQNPYLGQEMTPEHLSAWHASIDKCTTQAQKDKPETWCSYMKWKDITMYTERQDSVYQLAQLYDSDLPGTLNLFPKKFYGYNTSVPGRHAGEAFAEKDAFVGFWGAPVRTTDKRIPSVRNGSLPPTIYDWLMQPSAADWKNVKGFAYPSVLKSVIKQ